MRIAASLLLGTGAVHPIPMLCGQQKDVRVVSSDRTGVTVEYSPAYGAPSKFTFQGKEFNQYDFEKSVMGETRTPGAPELVSRSLLLKFPGESDNTIDIINAEYEDIPNILLAPVPNGERGEIDPVLTYTADPVAYSRAGFLPETVALLSHIGESQGAVLGELRLHPLQYNPALRTLRKYSRIVVRVNFGSSSSARKVFSNLSRGVAINDQDAGSADVPATTKSNAALRSSVLSSGTWYRFPVTESGIYKFTGRVLLDAGIPPATDPRTIKIYSNGGFEVPLDANAPAIDDLRENAVDVSDGGTAGHLDAEDYVVFFAKSTRGWRYNSANRTYSHYINHFSETNYCWLTYDGGAARAMTIGPPINQPSAVHPVRVPGKAFREDERVNLLSSGLEWLGPAINSGDQMSYVQALPGLDPAQPMNYRFHLGASSLNYSYFTIFEHNVQLGPPVGLTPIFGVDSRQLTDVVVQRSLTPAFSGAQSQLRFSYSGGSAGSGYVDWYEIFYQQMLTAQNDVFSFQSADTSAIAQYDVTGFSGGTVLVFDVTRFDSVSIIPPVRLSADTCSFQMQLTAGTPREVYAVGESGFKTPGSLTRIPNQDLHGDTTQADYIIVSHPDFIPAARRLESYREQQPAGPLRTMVVDVEKIYNEFGGGSPEPAAIRNYLRYRYANSPTPPRYVLLFGDGDYDYRRIVGSGPNWIPPWESAESYDPLSTYATDDDFAIFNAGGRVSLGIGRLTSRTLAEANTMVEKIIEYETAPVEDPWKLRISFVADDARRNDGVDAPATIHLDHAEEVAALVPSLFENRKIYLFEYPTVFTPSGRRKPEVNQAIDDQINQGTLILNYSGHGNPRLWAHEYVFVRESDFPLLHNKGKYFFLVAATCNFSMFDVIGDQSGGEILTAMPDAGAIACFSATRPVFAGENRELNIGFFQQLFQTSGSGRLIPQRLGDVVYRTKQFFAFTNDRKYFLLGDPALRISFPTMYASVDSINHQPGSQTAQLQALSRVSITSSVRDTSLSNQTLNYSGQAQVVVYDANRTVQINDPDAGIVSWKTAGSTLFRGDQSVTNGVVNASFIVPKDISYRNDFGRVTIYFWNSTSDGAGYTTNVRVGGTDSTASADVQGPSIRLFLDHRSFRPGDVVSAAPLLIADLADVHGINTSGSGVGHRLEAWLDGNPQSIDLSDYYQSATNRFDSGTVQYRFGPLAEGSHKLRMRAWDTYNNSSATETAFDVVTGVGLRLSNVFNFPNPFSSSTVFTFEHNQIAVVDAEVKIYTVAGRLIQSLKKTGISDHFVQIPWDGRDRDGDIIANGVYLYKVVARTEDSRFGGEALGKLSILK